MLSNSCGLVKFRLQTTWLGFRLQKLSLQKHYTLGYNYVQSRYVRDVTHVM